MIKLYVGNLPYSMDDQGLNDLFSEYGAVESATVIVDRHSNRSKGFGFVEMEDEAGEEAMQALEGKEVEGRNIKVSKARPKKENSGFRR